MAMASGGDVLHIAAELATKAPQIVADEAYQVLTPITKRGQLNRENTEAIVEIRAKSLFRGALAQIAVRSCDDTYVGVNRLAPTDAFEGLLLQHSQDFRLQRQWHIANFIEKNGAAAALLEAPDAAPIRAGEGAFFVTEKLALPASSQESLRS